MIGRERAKVTELFGDGGLFHLGVEKGRGEKDGGYKKRAMDEGHKASQGCCIEAIPASTGLYLRLAGWWRLSSRFGGRKLKPRGDRGDDLLVNLVGGQVAFDADDATGFAGGDFHVLFPDAAVKAFLLQLEAVFVLAGFGLSA